MDTREVIARFEVERQALAMIDHPNVFCNERSTSPALFPVAAMSRSLTRAGRNRHWLGDELTGGVVNHDLCGR